MTDSFERHLQACRGFSRAVGLGDGRWDSPSPCGDWDARGVVEHVIGFHDVLLLRPLGAKPQRPKGDPVARWAVTSDAIVTSLSDMDETKLQAVKESSGIALVRLVPMLTTEVLVHTWDLARAIGEDPALDPGLCDVAYEAALLNAESLQSSNMFAAAISVTADADAATKLIALLGRDPLWSTP